MTGYEAARRLRAMMNGVERRMVSRSSGVEARALERMSDAQVLDAYRRAFDGAQGRTLYIDPRWARARLRGEVPA